jgi:hypothetical protein
MQHLSLVAWIPWWPSRESLAEFKGFGSHEWWWPANFFGLRQLQTLSGLSIYPFLSSSDSDLF